jgi:hypothetical protein
LGIGIVRVVGWDEHLGLDLLDLGLEFLEASERRRQPVLAQLVLALGEVRGQLVAERVGNGNGFVGGRLGGRDPQGAVCWSEIAVIELASWAGDPA